MKRVISVIQAIVIREDRTRGATLDKPTKHSLTPEEKKSGRRRRPLNTGKTQEGKRRWEEKMGGRTEGREDSTKHRQSWKSSGCGCYGSGTPYLPCASRFVIADLIFEVFLQNVSDGELLPSHVNAGHGVRDVDEDSGLVHFLHGERHSTDVACHRDACLHLHRRTKRYKSTQQSSYRPSPTHEKKKVLCECFWSPQKQQ